MSMFHANINYYIIIILSPYSINSVQYPCILIYTVSFIQYNRVCVILNHFRVKSGYQYTLILGYTLNHLGYQMTESSDTRTPAVFPSVSSKHQAAVWLRFVSTHWEVCVVLLVAHLLSWFRYIQEYM